MRRLTLGFLCATYLCLSLIVALTLWRNGGGWGAGVAALVGGLGLCFAFHGLIERALESGAMRGEVESLREAHAILIGQVEALDARLGEIADCVKEDGAAMRRWSTRPCWSAWWPAWSFGWTNRARSRLSRPAWAAMSFRRPASWTLCARR